MSTNQLPQQKELESAISELRVFMDINAVSLYETNTAGKSGYFLTILEEVEAHINFMGIRQKVFPF